MNPKEIFERYLLAGLTRDPAAQAALFTDDGVYEAPLLPPDSPVPSRLEGHEQLREGFATYHRAAAGGTMTPDPHRSGYVLHTTADPDVFIVEIDSLLTDGTDTVTMSLLQIFRLRDGKIARLRDYFAL
jgi:ketosteroid isomerase-like protein